MKILITGANGGFGNLTTRSLLAKGHSVAASIRDPKGRNAAATAELEALGAIIVEIDVTDDTSVESGVSDAMAKLGGLDVLVNNAGMGAHGLIENFSAADFQHLFDINVFGVQRMNRAVLPAMREQKSGLLVHISSLLGRVTMPFYGPYNASKWALEAMAENYRAELSGFGIEVSLIEPGGFPTDFMGNLLQPSQRARDTGYGEMAGAPASSLAHFTGFLAQNPQQTPQIVADAVVAVIDAPRGQRAFRTPVDKIGMGDAVAGYNDYLQKVTEGIYQNLDIADMLVAKFD